MNWVKEMCGKLGIKENEEWEGKGENAKSFCIYKLSDDGYLYYKRTDIKMEWDIDPFDTASLLTGKLKPVWKPKEGEMYYTPRFTHDPNHRYCADVWRNGKWDNWAYDNKLIFKTKQEAINCVNEMIILAKHGI